MPRRTPRRGIIKAVLFSMFTVVPQVHSISYRSNIRFRILLSVRREDLLHFVTECHQSWMHLVAVVRPQNHPGRGLDHSPHHSDFLAIVSCRARAI